MLRILFRLWIAYIPLVIFGVWYYLNIARKDVKVTDEILEKKKTYFFYTVLSSALLVIAMLLYFALSEPATPATEN